MGIKRLTLKPGFKVAGIGITECHFHPLPQTGAYNWEKKYVVMNSDGSIEVTGGYGIEIFTDEQEAKKKQKEAVASHYEYTKKQYKSHKEELIKAGVLDEEGNQI